MRPVRFINLPQEVAFWIVEDSSWCYRLLECVCINEQTCYDGNSMERVLILNVECVVLPPQYN